MNTTVLQNLDTAYLVRLGSLIEYFLCALLYSLKYNRKKYFGLRVGVVIFCGSIGNLLLAVQYNLNNSIPFQLLNFVVMQLYCACFLYILFDINLSGLLFCICSGIATQGLEGRLIELIFLMCGKDSMMTNVIFDIPWISGGGHWFIYYMLHIVLICILAFLFRRRMQYTSSPPNRISLLFCITITVLTVPINIVSRTFESQNYALAMIIRIYVILYSVLVLITQKGILHQNSVEEELKIMDEMLEIERRQFDSIQEDMQIINMKCHDIRHELDRYEGKLAEDEFEALRNSIQIYDCSIKTNNEILDVILYKKQLLCHQNNITLTCMADGGCLSFMSTTHLYSLLNNAIDNAIQAVLRIAIPDQRIISIAIGVENGLITIHVTNYFKGDCTMENGVPLTSNEDKKYHGLGVKSMQYIVNLYDGKISFDPQPPLFFLNICFPMR